MKSQDLPTVLVPHIDLGEKPIVIELAITDGSSSCDSTSDYGGISMNLDIYI